jgi:ABC-type phosphate/phosphonate transport system substrate-binding protein
VKGLIRAAALVAATIALMSRSDAAEPKLPSIRVGMIEGMFRDVPRPLILAAAEPFRSLMHKQTGLTGEVELCTDSHGLARKLKAKSCTVGVFYGIEYAWARKANPDMQPLLVAIPHGRKVTAMIVVSKNEAIQSTADLKGESVIIPRGAKTHSLLFLEKQRAAAPGALKTMPNPATLNVEEALTAVACGNAKAALVDAASLNGYALLQPGAFAQLRILVESESFPAAVIATCKGCLDDDSTKRIKEGLVSANKTAQGRTMLTMWSLKGIEQVPTDYDQQCEKILTSYPPPAPIAATPVTAVKAEK